MNVMMVDFINVDIINQCILDFKKVVKLLCPMAERTLYPPNFA